MPDGLIPNLDDINKTSFCIPFDPEEDGNFSPELPISAHDDRDLECGQELRFEAYRVAWGKCLNRMQAIISELQSASVASVVKEVKISYVHTLPGLPCPELPVVSIINPSLGYPFLNNITTFLESEEPISSTDQRSRCSVIHLYPEDFPNLTAGMRSIISSFLDKADLERGKHKPAMSLANYDIKLFAAWYKALKQSSDLEGLAYTQNLVVVLHDFEQFDPSVMQDVFYIFNGYANQLPVVFLLSMSSPSTNYLNGAYSLATMSLLRVRTLTAPSGSEILQEVLLNTFFSAEFEPDIMIGPTILEYLQDYFSRYNSSADAILTILQLAHLHHFSSDPLTILAHTTPSFDALSSAASSEFVNSLATRLSLSVARDSTVLQVIQKVDGARDKFRAHLKNVRIALSLMVRIQAFLESQGHKGLDLFAGTQEGGVIHGTKLFKAMLDVLRPNIQKDIEQLALLTRKFKRSELHDLLQILHEFYNDMPMDDSSLNDRTTIVTLKTHLRQVSADDSKMISQLSKKFSDWLTDYLESKITPLEDCDLWDVWYTGQTPFSSEMLNPSIRSSMMAGLLRPHDYAMDMSVPLNEDPPAKAIWELPDTSILFKRYLDSGKMINVYDWFESFKTVIDAQREQLRDPVSPKKRKGPKAKKQLATKAKMTEEDEEKWNLEVQARFVRAMQELDYLGLIKHTGRKADHLLRTVFDIDDAE